MKRSYCEVEHSEDLESHIYNLYETGRHISQSLSLELMCPARKKAKKSTLYEMAKKYYDEATNVYTTDYQYVHPNAYIISNKIILDLLDKLDFTIYPPRLIKIERSNAIYCPVHYRKKDNSGNFYTSPLENNFIRVWSFQNHCCMYKDCTNMISNWRRNGKKNCKHVLYCTEHLEDGYNELKDKLKKLKQTDPKYNNYSIKMLNIQPFIIIPNGYSK